MPHPYFAFRSIVFQMPNLLLLAGAAPTPPLCTAKHFAKLVYFEPAMFALYQQCYGVRKPRLRFFSLSVYGVPKLP